MDVLIVLPPGSSFSTAQNSIETVVANLSRPVIDGRSVRILCDHGENFPPPPVGLDIIRVKTSRNKWIRTAAAIKHVRRLKPDLIELHQHAPTASLIARYCADIPSILYKHGFVRPAINPLEKKYQELQYSSFSRTLFVSNAAKSKFQSDFPGQAHTADTITNAIDHQGWVGNLTAKEKLITYVGNAAPEKGFGELCGALAVTLEKHQDWSATLIAGHWDIHSEWADAVSKPLLNFGDRFNLLKNQTTKAVQDWQKRSSICLVPSICEEAFGLAALEAHLAGAAVISSGRGGLKEVSGPHAFYLDQVTSSTLEEAMNQIISDPALRSSLASEGQDYVVRTHRLEDRAQDLCAIETQIVEEFSKAR